jgi:hypothetical protein
MQINNIYKFIIKKKKKKLKIIINKIYFNIFIYFQCLFLKRKNQAIRRVVRNG